MHKLHNCHTEVVLAVTCQQTFSRQKWRAILEAALPLFICIKLNKYTTKYHVPRLVLSSLVHND